MSVSLHCFTGAVRQTLLSRGLVVSGRGDHRGKFEQRQDGLHSLAIVNLGVMLLHHRKLAQQERCAGLRVGRAFCGQSPDRVLDALQAKPLASDLHFFHGSFNKDNHNDNCRGTLRSI
eukprot:scaffold17342_cov31-Prasinocladus_malaysianus.AAC.1